MDFRQIGRQSAKLFTGMLLLAGSLSSPALAQTPVQPPAAAPAGPIYWAALELTPGQIKQINVLRLNHNQLEIKLKADIALKDLELKKQLIAPAANPNVIRQLSHEKLILQAKLEKARVEHMLEIRKLLTPAQRAKLPQAVIFR